MTWPRRTQRRERVRGSGESSAPTNVPDLDRPGRLIDFVDDAVPSHPEAMEPGCPERERRGWPWFVGECIDSLQKAAQSRGVVDEEPSGDVKGDRLPEDCERHWSKP